MKEVPKKELPDVSGGQANAPGPFTDPVVPPVPDYPQTPIVGPYPDTEPTRG